MNDFIVLDIGGLSRLFSDGPQDLNSLVASGQRIRVADSVVAELRAQACALNPPLAIQLACDWVIENLTGVEYSGAAAIYPA